MKKSAIILLHTGYWVLYLLLVLSFALALSQHHGQTIFRNLAQFLFLSPIATHFILPCAIGFYVFYFFLFPRFLHHKKFLALLFAGLLVSLLCALLSIYLFSALFGGRLNPNMNWSEKIAAITFMSTLMLIHGIIALVMRGFIVWFGDIKLKEELNQRNYETELALVKSQINPHFLFNTINNIDVLMTKDAEKASEYLNKLSDIMRFMLYESKVEKIPLSKELAYIEKYIDLQKIRTSNPDYIHYSVSGETTDWITEPMLFIPFIENAFKHAENKKNQPAIKVRFLIEKNKITFECENYFKESASTEIYQGGLGNNLIQRRLNLLYPGSHQLDFSKKGNLHSVNLIITKHDH
jgi:two-component system, LytTR family, sensor kinase